jgi:HEAT repeat protein
VFQDHQDHRALLHKLAFPHHAGAAYRALLAAGPAALPTIRDGLRHGNGDVRLRCCQFFDQFLIPEVMGDLLALLDDPDERVRCMTLHVLDCDRCKQGSCRPDEARLLPRAIALLERDPDAHVRAHAIGAAGRWVHTNPGAAAAIARAHRADPSPAVRKKAGMLVPGGALFRKSMPRRPRAERRRASA